MPNPTQRRLCTPLPQSFEDQSRDDLLLISAKEASRRLAISPRMLSSLVSSGDIPVVRIGRRVLFSPDALRDWIARLQGGER